MDPEINSAALLEEVTDEDQDLYTDDSEDITRFIGAICTRFKRVGWHSGAGTERKGTVLCLF